MFDICAVVNIWTVKLAIMFDSCAVVNISSLKLTIMFDTCAVVKHRERGACHYV
jgi:hypothetical protein